MKVKKGIVLAGGTGSRLGTLTKYTNKHCLPCGLAPMIYYPISQFIANDISDICVVSGLNHIGSLIEILGSGNKIGCSFTYRIQDVAGGIAEALSLCKNFAGEENIAVFLGDNIFGEVLDLSIENEYDAILFLKEVIDPNRFGIAEVDHLKKLVDLEEKPKNPKSNMAITGAYIYSPFVWHAISKIKRSSINITKGELEISSVNSYIIKYKTILTKEVKNWWADAGTTESYRKVNEEVWNNLSPQLNEIIDKILKVC